MAKLSVIVPAYNAETTLRTAVESILSQQVPGLEIIIVNDGSTDATDKICHALASQNQCIHVITQKNAGICAARNRGLEAASGEFLTFCDDDDLLWQGALKLLLQTAEDTHADIVRGGYELLRQRLTVQWFSSRIPPGRLHNRAWQRRLRLLFDKQRPAVCLERLYRRTSLLGLRFNERCSFGWRISFSMPPPTGASAKQSISRRWFTVHFEARKSTSCARSAQALLGRIRRWSMDGGGISRRQHWCDADELQVVWKDRRAQAVTFLMHQLRDAHAPGAIRRRAWQTLRQVLGPYPGGWLTFYTMQGTIKNRPWHCFYTRCGCRDCMICCRSERNSYENDSCYRRGGVYRPSCCKECP